MTVKAWFIHKNFTQQEAQAINNGCTITIVSETEKAYKLNFQTNFGSIVSWVPKSVCEGIPKEAKPFVRINKGDTIKTAFGQGYVMNIDGNLARVKTEQGIKMLSLAHLQINQ
jgi:hypothetical protein